MAFKRNFKLYLKEKSTITAGVFMLIFTALFLVSFIKPFTYVKGLRNEFKVEKITFLSSNNYDVTYAASSNNHLYYSQNKAINSSLNKFADINVYANEYGEADAKRNNFIKINFDFPSRIIDIQGTKDNMIGEGGETLVLLENGNLYLISARSKSVCLILRNVVSFKVMFDSYLLKNVYLIYDDTNNLSIYSFASEDIYLQRVSLGEIFLSSFFNLEACESTSSMLVLKDGSLNKLSYNINDLTFDEPKKVKDYIYNISEANTTYTIEDLNIPCEKIVDISDYFYCLSNGEVTMISYDNEFVITSISCDQYINDIYTCGNRTLIALTNKGLYFTGDLYKLSSKENTLEYTNVEKGLLYGSYYSLFLYDNNSLFIYDDEKELYDIFYQNWIVVYLIRYFSLFVMGMIVFYFTLSYYESSKRYNRYFKSQSIDKN